MRTKFWIALAALGLLTACGNTALERGATGGLAGAAAGEVIADEPLIGAAVGAGAGVLTQ